MLFRQQFDSESSTRELEENLSPGGMLRAIVAATGKSVVFYSGFGDCSSLAAQVALELGLNSTSHLRGGRVGWPEAGGAITGGRDA